MNVIDWMFRSSQDSDSDPDIWQLADKDYMHAWALAESRDLSRDQHWITGHVHGPVVEWSKRVMCYNKFEQNCLTLHKWLAKCIHSFKRKGRGTKL